MRISDWSSDVCSSDLQAIPLPEWLYEEGIGESRAALVHKGEILEAYVERDGKRALAGAVAPGRLIHTVIPRRRGIVRLDSGEETLLEPIQPKLADGANDMVEIDRNGTRLNYSHQCAH